MPGLALVWLCASLFGLEWIDTAADLSHPNPAIPRTSKPHPSEVAHDPTRFSAFQREAADAANRYRRLMRLPVMRLDPSLCRAAHAHGQYLAGCGAFTHEQKSSQPGFTGRMPWDRAQMAGYPFGCTEDISSYTQPRKAIDQLMAAPYHRVPFMEPAPVALGVGCGSTATVLEFDARPGAEGISVYPADGQVGVPTAWNAREVPDPLRMHNVRLPVGYVISYQAYSTDSEIITFGTTRLSTEDGREIPCFRNTPDTDMHLKNGLLLIPSRPLDPSTRYRVIIEARTDRGQDVSKSWGFTTAAAPVPSQSDEYVRLAVRCRSRGTGAWLGVSIHNKSRKTVGPYLISVMLPNKIEARAPVPVINPGRSVDMGVAVKSAHGEVRLLSAASNGRKPQQLGSTAKFDVRAGLAHR